MRFLPTYELGAALLRSGSGSGSGSGGTPNNVTNITLFIDANVTPPTQPQPQYAPLTVLNSDGTAPTLVAGAFALASGSFAGNISAVVNAAVIPNNGPSAAAMPYGAGFAPVAPGTATFTLVADGQVVWTYNITVQDTAPETFTSGNPVPLPVGSSLPPTLSF